MRFPMFLGLTIALLSSLGYCLYIFDNMIEPYLKEPIPAFILSKNEKQVINLNKYYGGSQITFKFDAFNDPFIQVSTHGGISISSNKSISDTPIEILLFPDQNGFNISGVLLTDQNKIYSIAVNDIYKEESDLMFLAFIKLPDDLTCRKMTEISSLSVLLDCDSKNPGENPQFLVVDLYMSNNIKNIEPTYIRINNSYHCSQNESFYRSCNRSIKVSGDYIYRYCKLSKGSPCGALEIFKVNWTNQSASLYKYIDSIDKKELKIQGLQIYDSHDIFILDYHFGLFEVIFNETSLTTVNNGCPDILGGNYYNLHFDCFNKDGIHNDFEECKLIVTSSHYISELTFSKSLGCQCCLENRKNLGENIDIVYNTYFSDNYIIIYYTFKDSDSYFLNVYDRNDANTNILYQTNLTDGVSLIRLLTTRTNFYFSSTIVNKLLVFSNDDHRLYLINIGQNIINIDCCTQFPSDNFHMAHLEYSVLDLNQQVKRKDKIYIYIASYNEQKLFTINSSYTFDLNLSFLSFKVPVSSYLKGPNQNYKVNNEDSLSLEIKQSTKYTSLPFQDELPEAVFLKTVKVNLNYFFFIQNKNLTVAVYKCLALHASKILDFLDAYMMCWNLSHEIVIKSKLSNIIVKEDRLIAKTSNDILISYYFKDQTYSEIKFDGFFEINNQPLVCPHFLFNLVSSHCLCISYTMKNNFLVSIFDPVNNTQGENKTSIMSYNYTNEFPDEKYEYFDQTLLSNDIIFAKGPHCIHILKLTYNEDDIKNTFKNVMVIDNEFTQVENNFTGYHFSLVKSNQHQKIMILIANYEKNLIGEFNIDDLISPILSRIYPLYDYKLDSNSPFLSVNDQYLIVGCSKDGSTNRFLLFFDVFKSTESTLVKVIECDMFCWFYFANERNFPLNQQSREAKQIDFFVLNLSQPNQSYFEQYIPGVLEGSLQIENIEKQLYFNETTRNYQFTSNYDENQPYNFNVSVENFLSPSGKNITFNINFDYTESIISYSDYLLNNSNKNLTLLDLSENNETILSLIYNGPTIGYTLSNDKPESSNFELKSFAEFNFEWEIKEKLNKFKENKTIQENNLMVIPTDDYLFVLSNLSILMLNFSAFENDDKFDIIDVFDLNSLGRQIYRCNSFEIDENTFLVVTNYLYFGCEGYNQDPQLFLLSYDSKGFDKRVGEIIIEGIVNNVNSLKVMNNFIFIINEGKDTLNDCSIFIFQIDLPVIPPKNTSRDDLSNFVIPLTNLYILNAQSFNVDYLFIFDFELSCLGMINGVYIYGIILNDQYALYYCEIGIDPTNKIDDFYNKSISDFILKSNTELNKLDLKNFLNLDYRDAEGAPSITSYWINSNVFGEMFILISTAYRLIEIKTSRFYFSGYFEIYTVYQEYNECYNTQKINSRSARNQRFLAFPCIDNHFTHNYTVFLKIYSKNTSLLNFNQSNSSYPMIPIAQMLPFPAAKFNDFFFLNDENNEFSQIFVVNGSEIKQFHLSESMKIQRTMLNRTIAGHEHNHLTLTAYNHISKAEIQFHVDNGFFIQNDWKNFFALIVVPIIFCFLGMILLFALIKYSRSKRKLMLLKLN